MDDFEGFKTSVEEVRATMAGTTREPKLEHVKPEDVTRDCNNSDKT